jgi:acetyltransferase-like isoleucine patch superfamily enzyme
MTVKLLNRIYRVAWAIARRIPTRLGSRVRVAILSVFGASIGAGVTIGPGCRVLGPDQLRILDGAGIARDVTVDARGGVLIGKGAMVGFEAVLLTHTHAVDTDLGLASTREFQSSPIELGSHVWLGARVFVMPGVSLGDRVIVGSCSVVTRSFGDGVTVAGVPARPIPRP